MSTVPSNLPSAAHGADCFPYLLVRVAGGPLDSLLRLSSARSLQLAEELRNVRDEIGHLGSALAGEIFGLIGGCSDRQTRRTLLNAKRELFNGRILGREEREEIAQLGEGRLQQLAAYCARSAQYERLSREYEITFDKEREGSRRLLRGAIVDESFSRALALASPTLARGVHDYLDRPPEKPADLHTERAIIKYLCRAHAKTSPFSSFGKVALAEITTDDPAHLAPAEVTYCSRVRLNNWLWTSLRPLLLDVPAIAFEMPIRVNPTLQNTSEGYRFLVNVNNLESFQTLPALDELSEIAEMTRSARSLGHLVAQVLGANLVEGDIDTATEFVSRLVRDGFLEFDLGVSGTNPDWDQQLIDRLTPLIHRQPLVQQFVDGLRRIHEQLQTLGRQDGHQRHVTINDCYDLLERLVVELQRAAKTRVTATGTDAPSQPHPPGIRAEHLAYEDCLADSVFRISSAVLLPIARALDGLWRSLSFSDGLYNERLQLTHYFVAKYGELARVPLIRVYEDYFRDCKVPEQRAQRQPPAEQKVTPYPGWESFGAALNVRRHAIGTWINALAARLRSQDQVSDAEVVITEADLAASHSSRPPSHRRGTFSSSVFMQLIAAPAPKDWKAVVNLYGPGYGKTMSRFLDHLPSEITEIHRAENRMAQSGSCLAEVRDASVSNANLHPPLLDFEISSPGAQTSFPPANQIPISDLWVSLDASPEAHVVLSRQSTAERVDVLDLGFQGLMGRSQLFRLLVRGFSYTSYFDVSPILRAAMVARNKAEPSGAEISRHPRVIYEDRLVLQRRSWTIPPSLFPFRARGEPESSFFRRVNDWRRSLEIPRDVFVYLTRKANSSAHRQPKSKLSRDDYKPQFISFDNYFTVDLLEKMLQKAERTVSIEEMLPSADELLFIDQRRYVTEVIAQWKWSES